MSRVILTAALTGAVTSRADTPHLPLTPEEIAEDATRCVAAGAATLHLHARDAAGKPSLDPRLFREIVQAVRERTKALICLSTSSWGTESTVEARLAAVDCQPDLVSFHVASMNRGHGLFLNPPEYQTALARAIKSRGIKPEFELFDFGHLRAAIDAHKQWELPDPFYVQFVLGTKGGCPAEARHLIALVEMLPPETVWSVAAVGRAQLPMNLLGLVLGGQVRTGLEDNVYLRQGELAPGNAALVERLALLAREIGREPASPAEARSILGIA